MFASLTQPEKFIDNSDNDIKIIADYDKKMLNYIGRLYKDLNGDTVDIDELENIVDVLAKYKQKSEYSYLENLIHPEKAKGCKIPSPIPVPSTSFQLHNSLTLQTNDKGNLAIVFNPFFLYNSNDLGSIASEIAGDSYKPDFYSSFFTCRINGMTGLNSQTFTPINVGQGIPNVYDQYRLVSASLVVKYIGRMDITSGVIGGAIVFDENKEIGASGKYTHTSVPVDMDSTCDWTSKYGNFDLAMDSFYHQENLCIEGLRMLYFPIDNTFEEYTKLGGSATCNMKLVNPEVYASGIYLNSSEDYNKSGFNWMVYVLGAPVSASCFKVDFYLNFECLPNASFLNYMPITPSCGYVSAQEKKESITIVQNKPVMKSNETITITKDKTSAWKKLKKAFQGALPSIGKLITKGIIQAIPYMKPGLALAGTMLEAASGPTVSTNLNMSLEDVE